MKLKFSLFFLFVLTCLVTSHAQIDKGSVLLGTSIGYNQVKTKNETSISNVKTQSFIVSPSVGIAIKENLVAGIRFDYMKNTQKSDFDFSNHYNQESKYYGGSIFIRRYVPLVSRLYVFGEGSASYTITRETATQTYYTNDFKRKVKGWGTGLHITPGISYGVCKKLQVELGFNSLLNAGYEKSKSTSNNNTQEETRESFSGGISKDNQSMFFIGFRAIL